MTGAKDSLDYIQFILSNNYKKNYKIINKHLKDKYGRIKQKSRSWIQKSMIQKVVF